MRCRVWQRLTFLVTIVLLLTRSRSIRSRVGWVSNYHTATTVALKYRHASSSSNRASWTKHQAIIITAMEGNQYLELCAWRRCTHRTTTTWLSRRRRLEGKVKKNSASQSLAPLNQTFTAIMRAKDRQTRRGHSSRRVAWQPLRNYTKMTLPCQIIAYLSQSGLPRGKTKVIQRASTSKMNQNRVRLVRQGE